MTLNRVLPDAGNDGVREINMKVTEEKYAVRILERNNEGRSETRFFIRASIALVILILQYSL